MTRYFFSFPSTDKAFRISDDIFGEVVDAADSDLLEKQRMKLIVSELFMNAFIHGNKSNPEKFVDVILEFDNDIFAATVKDQGKDISIERFKAKIHSVTNPEAESGRGINIIHKLCEDVQVYRDQDDKFCVRALRRIYKKPHAAPARAGKQRKTEVS